MPGMCHCINLDQQLKNIIFSELNSAERSLFFDDSNIIEIAVDAQAVECILLEELIEIFYLTPRRIGNFILASRTLLS